MAYAALFALSEQPELAIFLGQQLVHQTPMMVQDLAFAGALGSVAALQITPARTDVMIFGSASFNLCLQDAPDLRSLLINDSDFRPAEVFWAALQACNDTLSKHPHRGLHPHLTRP